MTLTVGSRLGPYEILSPLGAGGMGEVYKGRDTRLDRTVAIKVLPEPLASDSQFRERFEREARLVGSLNHPHICTLHDVGRHGEFDFLIMEYLEGHTLQDRLSGGALPLAEALKLGIQIADALAAAHRAGVIHRDLKPGNIMLTKAGAKLLDFGLAKTDAPGVAGSLSMMPTTPPGLTVQGTILGTFQYMAPEQLEGKEADARTDIFAFGTVLYEMLTGRKAFEGQSHASLIGAILKDTPPRISTLRPDAPPALDGVIAGCLAKNPDDRWHAARDVLLQLRAIADAPAEATVRRPPPTWRLSGWLAWAAALLGVLIGAVAFATRYLEPADPEPAAIQFAIDTPGPIAQGFAISPDGRRLVFDVVSPGADPLWMHSFDSSASQPLPGTESGLNPFWSPDGRSIGFFAEGKLKIIDVAGGPPRVIAEGDGSGGASWSRDGVIVFGSSVGPLYRISDTGGTPTPATVLEQGAGQTRHLRPSFLPDGRHFIFLATSRAGAGNGTFVASLDSAERSRVDGIASSAAYAPPGYLLFARGGLLMAQPFDPDRRQLSGEPMPLGEVRQNRVTGFAAFSISQTGILARLESESSETQLTWVTRDGKGVNGFPPHVGLHSFGLAPDQERTVVEDVSGDLWLLDARRGTVTRFTTDPGFEVHPAWSPDGRRVAFTGGLAGEGERALMLKVASGVSETEVLLKTPTATQLTDWSVDGRTLVFEQQTRETGWDLGVVDVDGDRTPRLVVRSRFQERMGTLSPDGRHLAYVSDEAGRPGIYVVAFPDMSEKWTVSTDGGTAPRWSRNGTELFFVNQAGMLTSVPVSRGPRLEFGTPRPMFELRGIATDGFNYAVSADGQRFLVARATDTAPTPITVVVNWPALLKNRGGP